MLSRMFHHFISCIVVIVRQMLGAAEKFLPHNLYD